jgi:cytochrome P450
MQEKALNGDDFAQFDINSHNHRKNVEGIWDKMRARDTLPHSDMHGGFYVFTKYTDVSSAARNTKTFSSAEHGIAIPDLHAESRLIPVETDPPQHSEYRAVLLRFVSGDAMRKQEALLRTIVRDLYAKCEGLAQFDFVQKIARPYPAIAILTILGIPDRDIDRLAYLVDTSIDGAAGEGRGGPQMLAAGKELSRYLEGILQAKRETPCDPQNIVSALVHASLPAAPFGPGEQSSFLKLLIFGGFTTTTFALASAVRWLIEHPYDLESLLGRPELMKTAVDEFIRFSSPGTYLGRTVKTDTMVGATPLRAGDRVILSYGAANRDPDVFPSPDKVLLDRSPNPHLGFGHGPHACMGLHLARLELRVALEESLPRIGGFSLNSKEPVLWASGETQGMTTLPLNNSDGSEG